MTWSSSVNFIGVFITGFGAFLLAILPLPLPFGMVWVSLSSFVKSVALDARYGVIGRSFTLFNENALPPNSERAWLILLEISGLTDKLFTLPYFGLFLSSTLPWLKENKWKWNGEWNKNNNKKERERRIFFIECDKCCSAFLVIWVRVFLFMCFELAGARVSCIDVGGVDEIESEEKLLTKNEALNRFIIALFSFC